MQARSRGVEGAEVVRRGGHLAQVEPPRRRVG
eukprot:CAMPEP_0172639688 /NCGR_PEP_ID=MMETSP1068-20121228/219491_1 /TAXON_ID=35684 /ORGANISM="Pseudopedinella elastica, Strain CCMP716" /LENGTH=31 /DNA_ID= /DNA_START= /DNA_END= /DNA_ORIENTATION=